MRLKPQIQDKKEQIDVEISTPGARRSRPRPAYSRARMSDKHGGVPPRGRALAALTEVII